MLLEEEGDIIDVIGALDETTLVFSFGKDNLEHLWRTKEYELEEYKEFFEDIFKESPQYYATILKNAAMQARAEAAPNIGGGDERSQMQFDFDTEDENGYYKSNYLANKKVPKTVNQIDQEKRLAAREERERAERERREAERREREQNNQEEIDPADLDAGWEPIREPERPTQLRESRRRVSIKILKA